MIDLADRKSTIRNQLERITKETTKVTPERNINMSPNKTSYNAKRLESPKKIWQISKRRNARLICQLHYFIKLLIERIYTYIFLCIINILRINTQLFLESKKKMIEKSIYNNEKNQEKMNKTNQKKMHFISFIFISFISTIKEKMNKAKKMDLSTNNGGTQSYGHILFGVIKYKLSFGEMAEWLIAPVLKTGIVLNKELSRVRIPLSPFFAR